MEAIDEKTYGAIETLLNFTNKNFVSLHDKDMKEYNEHLIIVLTNLFELMKKEDVLFEACYQRIYYAGSFYDGLKVGLPTEFDLDMVIKLPLCYDDILVENKNVPAAFVKINCSKTFANLRQHPKWTEIYRPMDRWIDKDSYLLQTEFKNWIEGVLTKALKTLPNESNSSELKIPASETSKEKKYRISVKKTGPAMTLNVTIPGGTQLDVDLVPVIEFKYPLWPPQPVKKRPNNSQKESWFVVPKPRKTEANDTYWRLAFHDQEREVIHNRGPLKPVCRLLKKLRDNLGLAKIASYYIKTIFLWEASQQTEAFWKNKQSYLYLYMLKKLREKVAEGRIDYFWDKRYNLLEGISDKTMSNLVGRLDRIIKDIERKVNTDHTIVAESLLCKIELETLKNELVFETKPEKPKEESGLTSVVPKPVKCKLGLERQSSSSSSSSTIYSPQQSNNSNSMNVDIFSKLDHVLNMVQVLTKKSVEYEVLLKTQQKLMEIILMKVEKVDKSVKELREDNNELRCQNNMLRDKLELKRMNSNFLCDERELGLKMSLQNTAESCQSLH